MAALRTFVFKCDARNGPPLHHRSVQNQPLSSPHRRLRNVEIFVKIFSKTRKLSEIMSLTFWTSNTVKQGVRKMLENVGNWPPIFCGPLKCRVHCRPPLCTALPSFQFCNLGFSRFVPHCRIGITTANVLNQASDCRTLTERLRTTKQWKNNIASNFCKNPFAKYPFFSAAD